MVGPATDGVVRSAGADAAAAEVGDRRGPCGEFEPQVVSRAETTPLGTRYKVDGGVAGGCAAARQRSGGGASST